MAEAAVVAAAAAAAAQAHQVADAQAHLRTSAARHLQVAEQLDHMVAARITAEAHQSHTRQATDRQVAFDQSVCYQWLVSHSSQVSGSTAHTCTHTVHHTTTTTEAQTATSRSQ